jgi:hypothetical protein
VESSDAPHAASERVASIIEAAERTPAQVREQAESRASEDMPEADGAPETGVQTCALPI